MAPVTDGVRIECAFSTAPNDTAPAYEEISSSVLMSPGLSITRGRSPEGGQVSPSTCSLTLINDDGRFTANNPASPYYPNLDVDRRLRVSYRDPASLGLWNLAGFLDAQIESGSLTSWWNQYFGGSSGTTLTSSTTRSFGGTRSVLVTWPTATKPGAGFYLPTNTLVKGRRYVAALPVFVPADGSPSVKFGDVFGATPNVTSTVTGRWQVLRVAFTATKGDVFLGLLPSVAPTAGQTVYMGRPRVDECGPNEPATALDAGDYNATVNPSFEVDASGWVAGSGLSLTRTPHSTSRVGGAVGRVAVTTAQTAAGWLWFYGAYPSGMMPASPGQLWAGRISLREVGTGGAVPLIVRLGAYDAAGAYLSVVVSSTTVTVPSSGWVDVDVPAVVACPANTAYVRWLVYSNNAAAAVGDAIDVDAAQADLVSSVGATLPVGYIDGSLSTAAVGVNLHPNGGADTDASGWFPNNSAVAAINWDDGRIHSSATVDGPTIASVYAPGPAGLGTSFAVAPGATVTATVDVIDPPPGMQATVYLSFRNAAGALSNSSIVYSAVPDALNRISSVPAVVPVGADRCCPIVIVTAIDGANRPAGTEVWLDNLDVRSSSPAHYVWTGTPHASPSQRFLEPFPTSSPTDKSAGPAIHHLFTGFVGQWPVSWPSGPNLSRVDVVATDRQKRVAERRRKLRSIVEEEVLSNKPSAYFPLGESSDSVSAGDVSGAGVLSSLTIAQVGSGGTVEFGAGTGPGTDGLSAPVFTPADASNGKTLTGTAAGKALNSDSIGFPSSVTLSASVATSGVSERIVALSEAFSQSLALEVSSTGKLVAVAYNPWSSTPSASVTSAASVNDGRTHVVSVSATTSLVSLYLDGALVGTFNPSAVWGVGGWLPGFTRLTVGGATGVLFAGTVGHVAVFGSALSASAISSIATGTLTGFAGERSDQRVSRLLSYAGVPVSEQLLDVGLSTNIDHVDTTGTSALEIGQRVTTTEDGVLFVNRSGLFVFHSRGRRYNAPAAAVFASDEVRPGISFAFDDQQLANDVTAKRLTGYSFRAYDSSSQDDYGVIAGQDLDLVCGTDAEVDSAAAWQVARRARPAPRMPNFVVNLLDDTVRRLAIDLEISDRVQILAMPAQAPGDTVDQFVEGYTETISDQAWERAYNTSSALAGHVFALDDPVYGVLDADNLIAY